MVNFTPFQNMTTVFSVKIKFKKATREKCLDATE